MFPIKGTLLYFKDHFFLLLWFLVQNSLFFCHLIDNSPGFWDVAFLRVDVITLMFIAGFRQKMYIMKQMNIKVELFSKDLVKIYNSTASWL